MLLSLHNHHGLLVVVAVSITPADHDPFTPVVLSCMFLLMHAVAGTCTC